MKKKMILLLMALLLPCLLFASCTSDPETTSKTSSEMTESSEVSVAESDDISSFEPLDVPEVVTRSHMVEKVGEDADLVAEALKLYAGQDTKYCVKVSVECDSDMSFIHDFCDLAAELYDTQHYCEGFPGYRGGSIETRYERYLENYLNGRYGTFYVDDGKQFEFWLTANYAELPEAALRAVLECNGTSVQLIDEIPENTVAIAIAVVEND